MASIFSRIISGDIPSYKIAETDDYYAFLDIRPMQRGHTLVIPKQEIDYLFDLPDELLAGLTLFAKKVAKAMEQVITCERIGVAVVGLEVPHAHIHLVPIRKISDLDFGKPAVQLTEEQMEETAKAIREKMRG